MQEPPSDTQHVVVAANGYVITASPTAGLEARSPADGYVFWSTAIEGTTWLKAGHGLVFAAGNGQLRAIDSTTGLLKWSVTVREELRRMTTTSTAIVVNAGEEIRALQLTDGADLWRMRPGAPVSTSVAVDGTLAVAGLTDHTLLAFDLTSGAERWRVKLDEVPIAIAAGQNRVYIGWANVTLNAFEQATGRVSWRSTMALPLLGDPLVDDRSIIATLRDRSLREFDARGGTMKNNWRLGGLPASGPLKAGAIVAVALTTGDLAFVTRDGTAPTRVAGMSGQLLQGADVTPDGRVVVTLGTSSSGSSVLTGFRFMPRASK